MEPGKPAWKLIIGHFGVDVLLDDGHIDRPKLGKIIFEDAGKRHLLNSCTHLYIQRAMLWEAVKFFLRGQASLGQANTYRRGLMQGAQNLPLVKG